MGLVVPEILLKVIEMKRGIMELDLENERTSENVDWNFPWLVLCSRQPAIPLKTLG